MSDDLLVSLPEISPVFSSIIKVIGVGGGGGNAVGNMYRENIAGVRFLVCNTDSKALADSPVPERLQIGPGLGAGGKPERGRRLAEENIETIRQSFDENTKMVFITAGMGGGTGTGAAPIVAREAMKKGILTIGIVTIPFLFEQARQIDKALDGVESMAKEVDALIIVNNERLRQIYSDLSFVNAFRKADDTLTKAVRSILEIIHMRGISILDFTDVDTCLRGSGVAVMSSGTGKGEKRLRKAIEDALNSPLLNDREIGHSRSLRMAVFFPPESSEHSMRVEELEELDKFMSNFQNDVDAKYGYSEDPSLTDEIRVTLLAAGFKKTVEEDEDLESRRLRIYGDSGKRHVRHRIYTFSENDLDNEELIARIEALPTCERTDKDIKALRTISDSDIPFEIKA